MFPSGGVAHSNKQRLMGYRSDIVTAWGDTSHLHGPILLRCVFHFPRPKSHYLPATKKRPTPVLREDAPHFHTRSPDVDKLLRAVSDALTSRAYADDAQIVEMQGMKVWSERGFTDIDVEEADPRW